MTAMRLCVHLALLSAALLCESASASIRDKSAAISTFAGLCETSCTCGTFRHPVESAAKGQDALFAAYPSAVETGPTKLLSKWKAVENPSLSLEYPFAVLFCQRLDNRKIPKGAGPISPGAASLFARLGVLVMRQGRLDEVLRGDLQPFGPTLEYADLSHNEISYIEPDALVDMVKLQEIDLRFNKLYHLGSRPWTPTKNFVSLDQAGGSRNFLVVARVRGNPLLCSCGLARTVITNAVIPPDDASSCYVNKSEAKGQAIPSNYLSISRQSSQIELLRLTCSVGNANPERQQPARSSAAALHRPPASEHHEPDGHRDLNKWILRSLSPSQRHHIADTKLNITAPHVGADVHFEDHSGAVHRVYKNRQVDIPLLVTMTAWFAMVYFGIVRFIKANEVERDKHVAYLRGLDESDVSTEDLKV